MNDYFSGYFLEMRRTIDELQPERSALDALAGSMSEQLTALEAAFRSQIRLPREAFLAEFHERLQFAGVATHMGLLATCGHQAVQDKLRHPDNVLSSDLTALVRRAFESSTQGLLQTGSWPDELLAAAISQHSAYKEFIHNQLRLSNEASEIARLSRITIVDAAATLLEDMRKGFDFTVLMGAASWGTELQPELASPVPVNLFQHLAGEIEEVDLEDRQLDAEAVVSESDAALLASRGMRIVKLVYEINLAAKREGAPSIFKPTNAALISCAIIPTNAATDEQGFSDVVDRLYFLLYEGSADAKRLTEGRSIDLNALWLLKDLRRGFRHDVDHGAKAEAARKNRKIGDAYRLLTGKAAPRLERDWIRAQVGLYKILVEMLESLWSEEAAAGN